MDDERRRTYGGTFQQGGEHYDRIRPGYPDEAVDWLVPDRARNAADVGAGTGKYTAALVARGLHVIAVDPSPDMLGQLERRLPHVTTLVGTAEETGIAAASMDLVTVAQAWHWTDPLRASAEAARILKPGGTLGLVWNQLDTSVPWVHRLSRIMHAGDVLKPGFVPRVGSEFAGLEGHDTRWRDPLSTYDVLELAKTRSYYLRANEATRAKVLENLRWYLHEHLGHSPGDRVELPYLTHSWRARTS